MKFLLQLTDIFAFAQNLIAGIAHLERELQMIRHGFPIESIRFNHHAAQTAQHQRERGQKLVGRGGVVSLQRLQRHACNIRGGHKITANRLRQRLNECR